jgi:hypothetical protein
MENMKRSLIIAIGVILALVTGGVVFYLREKVIVPREAQRFFELVDKAPDSKECFDARCAFGKQPRCLGARAVKNEVLYRLATVTNRESFYYLHLFCMLGIMQERGVNFEDEEWSAIRKATDRHGELPDHGLKFVVTTNGGRLFINPLPVGDMWKRP